MFSASMKFIHLKLKVTCPNFWRIFVSLLCHCITPSEASVHLFMHSGYVTLLITLPTVFCLRHCHCISSTSSFISILSSYSLLYYLLLFYMTLLFCCLFVSFLVFLILFLYFLLHWFCMIYPSLYCSSFSTGQSKYFHTLFLFMYSTCMLR
jgi:hypothetical protein